MKINPETKVFGIIGFPLSHSLSPVMHNRAFEELGINAVYLYFPCREVEGVVAGMKSLSIKGLSVTIPHKEKICRYVDELDPIAKSIGAINTLVNKGEKVIGYNTDAYGAVMALKSRIEDLRAKKVLIIGAGGASRAIGFALKEEGAEISITNRTEQRGIALAKELKAKFYPFSDIRGDFDIVIQTTPLGMYPEIEKMPSVPDSIFEKKPVVMDIIYNPMETAFLKLAKKKGCETISGVDMFVYQGAKQFELWTGKQAPVSIMRETVISFLKGKNR